MSKSRSVISVLVSVLIAFGCTASGSTGTTTPSAAGASGGAALTPSPSGVADTPRPSPTATSTATPRTTVPPGTLSLVGLGDSVPGALHCDPPCRSYVKVYGELASAALKKPVVVENLATNDGLTSNTLASRVKQDEKHRAALAAADLITITIGANDFQGPCDGSNMGPCLESGTRQVEKNLNTILDEIATLRDGAPTAIRVTTYYDWYVGDPNTPSIWGLSNTAKNVTFIHTTYSKALTAFNEMICKVATKHGAVCIDLLPVFNGASDTDDAGDLLGGDHLHPAKAGHDLIATTIAASGFSPVD